MPKKSVPAGRADKRAKKRVLVRPAAAPEAVVDSPRPVAAPVRSTWSAPARSSGRTTGLIRDDDYRYIYGDLRRIGMLAASLFAVLVVLTFVLR